MKYSPFTDNKLVSLNQLGYRPGVSCVNQLLAIIHEIYKSFDDGFKMKGIFSDISKAFDKVWHDGLLSISKWFSVSFLKLLRNFLYFHKRRVVLNGQHSSWENVNEGVFQSFILGQLLSLIYTNSLSNGVSSNCKLFADNTSHFQWLMIFQQAQLPYAMI